ncbi:unnamed protein product, partial [Ixodes persulcatus]
LPGLASRRQNCRVGVLLSPQMQKEKAKKKKKEGEDKEKEKHPSKAALALAEPQEKIAVGKLTARATTALGSRLCIAAATETVKPLVFGTCTSALSDFLYFFFIHGAALESV